MIWAGGGGGGGGGGSEGGLHIPLLKVIYLLIMLHVHQENPQEDKGLGEGADCGGSGRLGYIFAAKG